MKKLLLMISLILTPVVWGQLKHASFQKGEWIKYRIHYGVINAGYASIEVDEVNHGNDFHVKGKGWTTGMLRWVFPVKDDYQSYIHKESMLPYRSIRKLKEGGYTKNIEIFYNNDTALVKDHKRNREAKVPAKGVQDMISSFYYLRNSAVDTLKTNEAVEIAMFFDKKTHPFKMIMLGKETLKTKFGSISCYKFRPLVLSGRVFKEQESLTIWVTADKNRIPVRIKADLAVGSLKADLAEYKGLSYPITFL